MNKCIWSLLLIMAILCWLPSRANAAASCNELKRNIDTLQAKRAVLSEEMDSNIKRKEVLKSRKADIQEDRRRIGCLNPARLDRSQLRYCHSLNKQYVTANNEIDLLNKQLREWGQEFSRAGDTLYSWVQPLYKRRCIGSSTSQNVPCRGGYRHYPNQAIISNNIESIPNQSVSQCMEKCNQTSDCKSFDYGRSHNYCVLSNKNSNDNISFQVKPGPEAAAGKKHTYDYYERCL